MYSYPNRIIRITYNLFGTVRCLEDYECTNQIICYNLRTPSRIRFLPTRVFNSNCERCANSNNSERNDITDFTKVPPRHLASGLSTSGKVH